MLLTKKLQNIQKILLNKTNQSFFDKGYEAQKKRLESFREPKDLIERSYFQYLCQMANVPLLIRQAQNILVIPVLFYLLLRIQKKEKEVFDVKNPDNAVFLREGVTKDLLPVSLTNEFIDIYECSLNGNLYLDFVDKKFFLMHFIKYLKSPFFVLKCLMKMGTYSYVIQKYKPGAVITHNEYSFTSSFLTRYCNEMMVEHINIMHGEKLYNIRDSFFEFNRFYVWDEHYVDLFAKLRASEKQFIVEKAKHLQLNLSGEMNYKFQLTYYLGGEDERSLNDLLKTLSGLSIPKEKICIRYHPRYSNKEQIQNIFYAFEIQNPIAVSIEESLRMTHFVASLYSTVLYEAYYNGKTIMVDDLTNSTKYEKLKSLGYIVLNKEHRLLSELLGS